MGEYTKEYKITLKEFKAFVVLFIITPKCIILLLLLHTRALYPELIDKIADKITEVRFQKVFKDLDTLNIEKIK